MGGVLSGKLGQLLRLTMRSNPGRRTRLRAPRQRQREAQSLGNKGLCWRPLCVATETRKSECESRS
jgi:hypothetical protein